MKCFIPDLVESLARHVLVISAVALVIVSLYTDGHRHNDPRTRR